MRQWLESLEQFAIDVILERRYGKRASLLRMLLFALSLVFRQIVQARLWLYRKRYLRNQSARVHGDFRGEPDRGRDRKDARGGEPRADAPRGRAEGGDPQPGLQEPEAAAPETHPRAADGENRRVHSARGQQRAHTCCWARARRATSPTCSRRICRACSWWWTRTV